MKLKDKKVNIYREKYVPNGNGYMTKVTEPVALNVWAYFRQLSGKEIFAAAYRYDEEVLSTEITHSEMKPRTAESRFISRRPTKRTASITPSAGCSAKNAV